MPLTLNQLEERRVALEKYLQLLSQDPRISNGIIFNAFLLAAQQETASEKADEVDLDVYLMNESKVTIQGLTILQTAEVLEVSKNYVLRKLRSELMIFPIIVMRWQYWFGRFD